MTTRSGTIGIFTGFICTGLFYIFFVALRPVYIHEAHSEVDLFIPWLGLFLEAAALFCGGWLAARRSGSGEPWRCILLGTFSGGLAATLFFCLAGSAVGGIMDLTRHFIGFTDRIVKNTEIDFLVLFLVGGFLGSMGGGSFGSTQTTRKKDNFNHEDPQMAMNVAVTAVPACVFALGVAAFMCSSMSGQIKEPGVITLPVFVSLVLLALSHLALTLIVPHEVRQAEHRCGLDEVRMLACVGIAAGPAAPLLLVLIFPAAFSDLRVVLAILFCLVLSSVNLYWLVRRILPRREQLPAPWADQSKQEAILFGSISNSQAPRLIKLCTGCGLAMMLPLYISVISVLVNLGQGPHATFGQLAPRQALTSIGMCVAGIGVLILIYMIYLRMGRWFNHRGQKDQP
jgi:hypothetical protein